MYRLHAQDQIGLAPGQPVVNLFDAFRGHAGSAEAGLSTRQVERVCLRRWAKLVS